MQQNLWPTESVDSAFLENTIQQACLLLHASGGAFYLCDPVHSKITLAATYNLAELPWDTGLPERVYESRKAVIETIPGTRAHASETSGATVLGVPTIWRDSVRGVLIVTRLSQSSRLAESGDVTPVRTFDEQDASLLQPLADLTAAVLHQAERLTRMTAQFRALHVIDVALTSSLQLDRVLSLILDKAVALVGADHGSLRLLNPETRELVLKAYLGEGWTAEVKAYTFPIGHGIAGWVAENRQPYLCPDTHQDSQNVVLFEEMRSGVAVPLLVGAEKGRQRRELLGVLLLESSRPSAFDRHDIELLEALAQEAAIAIQNATQRQKLQSLHQTLQDEQERRVAAEKWTVMGQAATALAHRINNLIGIVPTSAGEIRRTLADLEIPPDDRAWIESNLDRIERNGRFILRMGDALFRPFQEPGPRARFDVNRLLNEALQAANLPPSVQVCRDYGEELPTVESNSLLVDVFLELIINARKAMEDHPRGCLEIRTRMEIEPISGSSAGPWVIIEVSDTGKGITPERMAHLWDMFHESADGLGFGLWWVRTFIERQGGTIVCDSTPGAGATFTVRLPAYPGVA